MSAETWDDDDDFPNAARLMPLEHGATPPPPPAKPDWEKAQLMIAELEGAEMSVADPWEDAIGVWTDDGTLLFRMRMDGTVEAPDYDRLPEAAVIFFKQVMEVAKLQGFTVRQVEEGWDA